MSPSVTSTWDFFHTRRDGDSTTILGRLESILSVKNFFLILSLSLSWDNLKPFHLILSFTTWEKRSLGYNLLSSSYREWEGPPVPPFLRLNPPAPSSMVWARRQWSPFTELQPSWIFPRSENKATTKLLFLKKYTLIWAASQPKVNVPIWGCSEGHSHAAVSRQVWWALRVK